MIFSNKVSFFFIQECIPKIKKSSFLAQNFQNAGTIFVFTSKGLINLSSK